MPGLSASAEPLVLRPEGLRGFGRTSGHTSSSRRQPPESQRPALGALALVTVVTAGVHRDRHSQSRKRLHPEPAEGSTKDSAEV